MAKQTNQEMMFQGWWNGWDYVENKALISSGSEGGGVSSVTIDKDGNLVVDDEIVGAVAAGSVLDDIAVDGTTLVISYHTEDDNNTKTAEVDLSEFVDTYTAATSGGIIVDAENKQISVDADVVALKTDLTDYLTTTVADETYQPIGNYVQSVALTSTDNNVYTLTVDEKEAGGFTIPDVSGFVSDVSLDTTDNNVYTLTVDGEEKGGFTLPDTSNLLDKETADETYQPKGNYVSSVSLDADDNNNYTLKVDNTEAGAFSLAAYATKDELINKVDWTDISTEDNPNRKSIFLANHDNLEGYGTDDSGPYNLAMVSKWDVADFGSSKIHMNINSSDRPTLNDEETLALQSDIPNNAGDIASLQAMIKILTAKVDALSQTNVATVDLSNLTGDLTDTTADYVLSGTLTSTATITGKSITLDDTVVIGNDNRLNLKANDVTINGSTISGEYVKNNGNSVIKIDECENVVIQNLTFDKSYNGYNGVEISLTRDGTTYPKNILIDGCEIGGTFTNNALNVYATADNATVTISNCHFVNVSNCLRISNTTKATGVTFNVVNCTVDQWEHAEGNEAYYGFFLGQDYTSASDEGAIANNLFGQDKITLNFTDLTHAGEKVCPADPYSVCGVDDGTQVVYTYADKHGKWYAADNKEMYPVVTFA